MIIFRVIGVDFFKLLFNFIFCYFKKKDFMGPLFNTGFYFLKVLNVILLIHSRNR